MIKKMMILIVFFSVIQITNLYSQKIKIVTENYPPYNYIENDKITGFSTEVLLEVLKITDFEYSIEVFPWSRAYMMALNEENVLIYSIGRTDEREKLFKWVGVIAPFDVYIFSLKSRDDIKIEKLEDAKKYKTLTTNNDVRERYLLSKGFEIERHIDNSADNTSNFEKLLIKRGDLWPIAELVANYFARSRGYQPEDLLKKSYHLNELSSEGLYMAFSIKTDDKIVDNFRNALEKVKNSDVYTKIKNKYDIN